MEGMKDSGIKWIGKIPADWKTKRIKYISTLKGRIGWQGLTSEEYQDDGAFLITGVDFLNGGINWEQCEHVPMKRWKEAKEIQIQNGDLLITKDGTVGKVAIVSDMPGETSLNSGVLRIMPFVGYSSKFLYWVLQSEEFWNWFNFKNAGNSTITHLYQGDFSEFIYTFPEYNEQEQIADFLNTECAKLDSIIETFERQIEVLKAYKKSLITETVTKGLNKNVEMKDSSIHNLSIPYDWNEIRFRLGFSFFKGLNITKEDLVSEGISVISYGQVHAKDNPGTGIIDSLLRYVPSSFLRKNKNCLVHYGDFIFADTSEDYAGVGNSVFIDKEDIIFAGYHSIIARPIRDDMYPKYYAYLFMSDCWRDQIRANVMGVKVFSITHKILRDTFILIPSLEEQKKIVSYLDTECSKMDSTIKIIEQQANIIKEHKKSLIYEYVTGKKRVKESI